MEEQLKKLADMVAAKLRAGRASADLTQREAAEQAGLSWMSVHRYERGKLPTLEALYRLAAVYGIAARDIIPEDGK